MGETSVRAWSISKTIGLLVLIIGIVICWRVAFTGTSSFASLGWPSFTEYAIGMGACWLGLAAQQRYFGWLAAVWGAWILVQAAVRGNLYGAGATFGTGVVIANALAVAYVALGLCLALRKSPRIR